MFHIFTCKTLYFTCIISIMATLLLQVSFNSGTPQLGGRCSPQKGKPTPRISPQLNTAEQSLYVQTDGEMFETMRKIEEEMKKVKQLLFICDLMMERSFEINDSMEGCKTLTRGKGLLLQAVEH